jgi:glycosyltransferase involved in cell wall biosynthesis
MKLAVLVESWGEPWNEGYKNLARYIIETVSGPINVRVIAANRQKIPILKDFDLIHIFNYAIPLHLFAYFAGLRIPILKHVAKKELDIGVRPFVRTFLNTKFVWDAFITTTKMLKEEIKRLAKYKPVYCVPPPIPTNYFKQLDRDECRQTLGLESEMVYLGYTGTLNMYRNLEVITNVFRLINNERIKLALSVTNISSGKLAKLKKLLATNMVKLVSAKDVRLFYSSVDLLVYPVKREGAIEPPLTILEAMSCGCMVAAYRNVVTSKLISDGYNGYTFSSSVDLAKIIRSLMSGRLDREAIAENARKTVIKSYDSSVLRKSYMELYKRLLNEL